VNLLDYVTAVREALGARSAKEAWAEAALPLLDRAAESELYATLSGKVATDGQWQTPDAVDASALVAFDPTGNVAVPANTSSQRLASGGVPTGRPGERWFESLPDCPCSWSDIPFGQKVPDKEGRMGKWRKGAVWKKGDSIVHPGATLEARWTADDGGNGQQCTYKGDKLITGGLGAGTPDLFSPWYLGDVWRHIREDVVSYLGLFRWLGDYSCALYQQMYPPNNGLGCGSQIVSPIDPDAASTSGCWRLTF
jgi:hypothetical protein